jgi:hypothetical protein
MSTQIIQQHNNLILTSQYQNKNQSFLLLITNLVPLLIWGGLVIYLFTTSGTAAGIAIVIGIPFFVKNFNTNSLFYPKRHIVLTSHSTHLVVGSKKYLWDDILFLSIREDENYANIRLEAKRKHILIKNESVIIIGKSSLEDAIANCKQVSDFFDKKLKINQIVRTYNRKGKGNDNENWRLIAND